MTLAPHSERTPEPSLSSMSETTTANDVHGTRVRFSDEGTLPRRGDAFRHGARSASDQAFGDAHTVGMEGLSGPIVEQVGGSAAQARDPSVEGTNAEGLPQEVQEGPPFIQGAGDKHEVDPNDVEQGHLGDCWLLAGLMAIARSNPSLIKNMIKPAGPGLWAVTFHFPSMTGAFEQETVVVDGRVPVEKEGRKPFFVGVGDQKDGQKELWPILIEKAYAKTQGKYFNIKGSNSPKDHNAMELVSGKRSTRLDPQTDEETLLNELDLAFRFSRRAVTLGTVPKNHPNASIAEKHFPSIRRSHTYAVDKVDKESRSLDLLDPWGFGFSLTIEIGTLRKVVDQIHVNG
jgi:hypothetical protein